MSDATPPRRRRGARTRRILRGVQILAGVTVFLGGFLAWREAKPFTMNLQPVSQQQAVFLAMERRPAHFYELESRFARRARIDSCVQGWFQGRNDPAVTADQSRARLEACRTVVTRNLTIAPASSNDWTIAAILAQTAGDIPAASTYLKRSLATGPTEQWIARRRAPLMFDLRDQVDDELRSQIDPQLALLLRTEEGIKSLARNYLANPSFRDRIISVAETVEPFYQKRFLDFVKLWAPKAQPAAPSTGDAG
ncbi:hypothetical protein C3941_15855 [Kaistia algarum]|uniref:hypothetical protein n=1 Tax=Kaistia algarum TaxID=2083279 RepID=UPI000CE7673B|nr:hypothetical protein [Kaistia algarum]MCX5514709.1 hypothetical protein [Kaistia algarum]PPE78866.1 hypothetical protein C3941_15855 [Kaistia algarum]